jgi:hypothetical protein
MLMVLVDDPMLAPKLLFINTLNNVGNQEYWGKKDVFAGRVGVMRDLSIQTHKRKRHLCRCLINSESHTFQESGKG